MSLLRMAQGPGIGTSTRNMMKVGVALFRLKARYNLETYHIAMACFRCKKEEREGLRRQKLQSGIEKR